MEIGVLAARIDNGHGPFSFLLSPVLQAFELIREQHILEILLVVVLRCVGDIVHQLHRHSRHISQAASGVQDAVDFGLFPRHVGIFLKVALDLSDSLINAAARFHVSDHLLLLILDDSRLPDHNLSLVFDQPAL